MYMEIKLEFVYVYKLSISLLPQVLKVIVTSRTISFTLLSPTHSVLSSTRVSAGVNFTIGAQSSAGQSAIITAAHLHHQG